jgi:hypothetical protein
MDWTFVDLLVLVSTIIAVGGGLAGTRLKTWTRRAEERERARLEKLILYRTRPDGTVYPIRRKLRFRRARKAHEADATAPQWPDAEQPPWEADAEQSPQGGYAEQSSQGGYGGQSSEGGYAGQPPWEDYDAEQLYGGAAAKQPPQPPWGAAAEQPAPSPLAPPDGENTRFTLLLIDYYAHGLTQSRRNSAASLLSAGIGVAAVITGAMIAIFRADTAAGVTASIVVSVAGAITNAIGVLFHRQANRALAHMESQTKNLRQDMRTDRETRAAIQLLDNVTDSQLRDRLLAGVILQLAQAQMPDGTVPITPSRELKEFAGLNGSADRGAASTPNPGPGLVRPDEATAT